MPNDGSIDSGEIHRKGQSLSDEDTRLDNSEIWLSPNIQDSESYNVFLDYLNDDEDALSTNGKSEVTNSGPGSQVSADKSQNVKMGTSIDHQKQKQNDETEKSVTITGYRMPSPKERRKIHAAIVRKKEQITEDQYHVFIRMGLSSLRTELTGLEGYLTMLSEGDFGKLPTKHKELVETLSKSAKEMRDDASNLLALGKLNKKQDILRHESEDNKQYKVLHFEDENLLTQAYALKFSAAGFDYKSYPNPTSNPVGVVKTEKPDLILMGIIMPIMDGITATKLIKSDSLTKDIPIIGYDNLGQTGNRDKFLQVGMADYWVFAEHTPSDVINKVREFLQMLPLADKSTLGSTKSQSRPKILFFEDERMLRGMYETKFSLEGFLVAGYDSPTKDPISIILKEKPDIIISGVIMPLMDGFAAARIYKADPRTKDIPLIFLTNLGMEENVKEANALGAVSYMVKAHFMPSEVVNRVREVLGLPIPPEKPIPPPGEAWHGPSVADLPSDKPKPWWKKLFG